MIRQLIIHSNEEEAVLQDKHNHKRQNTSLQVEDTARHVIRTVKQNVPVSELQYNKQETNESKREKNIGQCKGIASLYL